MDLSKLSNEMREAILKHIKLLICGYHEHSVDGYRKIRIKQADQPNIVVAGQIKIQGIDAKSSNFGSSLKYSFCPKTTF